MSFDETQHPRGHHSNPGRFTQRANSEPEAQLAAGEVARAPRRSLEQIQADLEALSMVDMNDLNAADHVARTEFEAGRDGTIAVVLERFPDATEIHIHNELEDDGETLFAPSAIWGPRGLLWSHDDFPWDDPWLDELRDYSIMTDRFGLDELFQPAITHNDPWYGFTID